MSSRLRLALLFGLFALRGLFSDFADPALSSAWAAAAAAVAAWGLWAELPAFRVAPALWAGLAWALLTMLSCAWSVDPGASAAQAAQLGAVALLSLSALRPARLHSEVLAWAMVLGAAGAAAAGLRQVLYGFPAARQLIGAGELGADPWTRQVVDAGRALGTFLAPDLLAAALGAALLLCVGLLLSRPGRPRLWALVCALLLGAGFGASRSVGAAIALLVGALALVLSLGWRQSTGRARLLWSFVGLALITTALLTAAPRLAGVQLRAEERLVNQATGLRAAQSAPLLGHGHNTFGVVAPALRDGEPLTLYAHGLIGQSASDLGAAGLTLVGLLLLCALWQALRALLSREAAPLPRAAAAAVLATTLHGLIDYDLLFAENLLYLLGPLALCADLAVPDRPRPRRRLRAGALVLLALALSCFASWRGVAHARAEWARSAERCEDRASGLTRAAMFAPPDARLFRGVSLEWLGCTALGDTRVERSLYWSERALLARPRDAILRAEHALVLALAGRAQEASVEADAAVSAWPRVGRVLAYRGLVALRLGRPDEAERWLARARVLDPQDSVVRRLVQALAR